MAVMDFLKYVFEIRLTSPYLFYGCIGLVVFLVFYIFKYLKRRKQIIKAIENQRFGAEGLTKIEANKKILKQNRSKQSNDTIEEKVISKNNLNYEANLRVAKELELPTKVKNENVIKEKVKLEVDTSKRITLTPYIDNSKVEIRIIKSVSDSGSSIPKRIGYTPNDIFKQIEPYKYAMVKMPVKNSILKFPRKGRSDKKGYTEDDFYIQLNNYFKSTFNVFNDRHIPTINGRPYEPDFVISTEKDNKNIFINIEIDEPYDGWLRTPTHCINENDLRDDFFTKRGWIVIRFAEIQIHQEPKKCCAFIAKVLHSIDPTFNSDLLNVINPTSFEQWDNLQAKKWAAKKYREVYLNIESFGKRSNIITEYEILESETDEIVEREIPKIEKRSKIEDGNLAAKNGSSRDSRISFDAINHKYFIDGNPDTISVTQLIDKFFPEFDSAYWAPIKARDRDISTATILTEWEAKRIDSANKGTKLHEEIENYYNGRPYNSDTVEFQQFLTFKERYSNMFPFRSEWRIFDEDLLVAGTIDMVFKRDDGSLYLFDWKRSEKVVKNDGSIKNDNYQFAFGKLSHLGDNSYNKYCLQQNIYKAILEKRYNQKISSMNLLIMHEVYGRYHLLQIPNMDQEVNYIFSYVF